MFRYIRAKEDATLSKAQMEDLLNGWKMTAYDPSAKINRADGFKLYNWGLYALRTGAVYVFDDRVMFSARSEFGRWGNADQTVILTIKNMSVEVPDEIVGSIIGRSGITIKTLSGIVGYPIKVVAI